MKKIKIEWQRLIIDEKTCPRCGGTGEELEKAVKSLKDQGIIVDLKKKKMSKEEFKKNPQESNRIMINDYPLEYWISGQTGKSPCCSACGDNECRTVEVNQDVYETVPAEIIVKASLEALRKGAE